MSNFRVVVPPNIPTELHAAYAAEAVRDAEAREQMRLDAIQARREKQAAIDEALAQIEKENKARDEKKLEAEAERAAKEFDAELKRTYFAANIGASELDWLRDKAALKGEAMRRRTLEQFENNQSIRESVPGDAETIPPSEADSQRTSSGERDSLGRFVVGNSQAFKRGQSGNPTGKAPSLTEILRRKLREADPYKPEQSIADSVAEGLLYEARMRNIQAIREVLDRIEGKPRRQNENGQYSSELAHARAVSRLE